MDTDIYMVRFISSIIQLKQALEIEYKYAKQTIKCIYSTNLNLYLFLKICKELGKKPIHYCIVYEIEITYYACLYDI